MTLEGVFSMLFGQLMKSPVCSQAVRNQLSLLKEQVTNDVPQLSVEAWLSSAICKNIRTHGSNSFYYLCTYR